jgi:hypothetical protein
VSHFTSDGLVEIDDVILTVGAESHLELEIHVICALSIVERSSDSNLVREEEGITLAVWLCGRGRVVGIALCKVEDAALRVENDILDCVN